MPPKKKTKRRLIKGKDYHAWTWKYPPTGNEPESKWVFDCFAEDHKKRVGQRTVKGKVVAVKFVEVK